MLKKFTKEGRFECGLDAIIAGKAWCFTVGNHVGNVVQLGIAIANEAGYNPIPLHWAHADTYDEMHVHVDELNEAEGISKDAAAQIVTSTMAAQNAARMPLNEYQREVLRVYGDGDYRMLLEDDAELKRQHNEDRYDDGLMYFLMSELSSTEDCDSKEEAVRRVETAIRQLGQIADALEDIEE